MDMYIHSLKTSGFITSPLNFHSLIMCLNITLVEKPSRKSPVNKKVFTHLLIRVKCCLIKDLIKEIQVGQTLVSKKDYNAYFIPSPMKTAIQTVKSAHPNLVSHLLKSEVDKNLVTKSYELSLEQIILLQYHYLFWRYV